MSWQRSAVSHTQRVLAASPTDLATRREVEADEEGALLSMVAAMVRRQNGGKLRVLDLGGGVGVSYALLLGNLVDHSGTEYHIVDLEWASQPRIHFHSSLPEEMPDIDIVYMNSALEWIEDYQGLLRKLCAYDASYFLLTRLRAGAFPTFASGLKVIPGSIVPTWFLNTDEIVEIMAKGRYSLLFNGISGATFVQRNFPKSLRLAEGHTRVLLFVRSH